MLMLSLTAALRAQDGIPETPVDTLGEVVVTAERIREIVPAQRLSGQQLQRLSSNSIADALRYFSGVQIKDYGGIGGLKTVNVRSLGSQHVGVFYDGIQISNAQNGTVDLGKFSMDNMEVLSVYNGQKSDIFQSLWPVGAPPGPVFQHLCQCGISQYVGAIQVPVPEGRRLRHD